MENLRQELEVPEAVRAIAERLEDAGYETWTVGGAVRDALLGQLRSDWDLATAARPEIVRELFRPTYPIGIQFGTVGVRGADDRVYEVTTFRRDIETDGRHAVVEYSEQIEEDLGRRDFTINAIAYHPLRGDLLDPFSGREDLRQRILRCVGQPELRFAEDYLRVLRGLRFAGRYRLEIESGTWEALKAAVPNLPRLSGERVREELVKVLANPGTSSILELYRGSGALQTALPELAEVGDEPWAELLRTVDAISPSRPHLRLAVLLRPAGAQVEALASRLRFSNAEIRDCIGLQRALAQPLPDSADVVSARRWIRDVTPERVPNALRLQIAAVRARAGTGAERKALAEVAQLIRGVRRRGDPVTIADLAIDGNDLKAIGLQPGPQFRRVLSECLEAVIREPALNERERLLEIARGVQSGKPSASESNHR